MLLLELATLPRATLILQCISGLLRNESAKNKCYALRFGFWGTLSISSGLRVTVFGLPSDTQHHPTNARLIKWQKKNNIRFFELWRVNVVADFPLVSITTIRLRYIIESCQSCQTVLFSGLRNISLQILRIVGRVWNEGSRILGPRLPSPTPTTGCLVFLPALIRPPTIWRVLHKLRCERLPNNEALQ